MKKKTMNRTNFTIGMGVLVTALLCIGLTKAQDTEVLQNALVRAQGNQEKARDAREHVTWVAKCLKDFQAIKAGMTRAEVEKRFRWDGGLQGVSPVRFTHPECAYFKIDVEFTFKRNPQDQGRAVVSPDDSVTKVSKPYIELPYID